MSSTGYIHPNGPTRKFKATAASAVTVGPALIIVANYLLALIHPPLPDAVIQAVDALLEAAVMLASAYFTAPAVGDQIAVAPDPAVTVAPVPVAAPPPVVAPPAPVVVVPPS